jgi:glutathione S-transferase
MKATSTTPQFVKRNIQNTKQKAFKNAQRRASEAKGVNSSKSVHGAIPTMELFQREDCPSSHAVRNRLTKLGLDFVAHNVPDQNALKHEQLVQAGGKDEVPFLIDHTSGVKLYESAAIISYLDKAYGHPSVNLLGRAAKNLDLQIRNRADQIAWTLQKPLQNAREIQSQVNEALSTMRGSLEFLRDRIETAVKSPRREKPVSASSSTDKAARPRGVRAHVTSATDAA